MPTRLGIIRNHSSSHSELGISYSIELINMHLCTTSTHSLARSLSLSLYFSLHLSLSHSLSLSLSCILFFRLSDSVCLLFRRARCRLGIITVSWFFENNYGARAVFCFCRAIQAFGIVEQIPRIAAHTRALLLEYNNNEKKITTDRYPNIVINIKIINPQTHN